MVMLWVKIAVALIIVVPLTLLSKRFEKSNSAVSPPKRSKKSRQLPRSPKRLEKIRSFIASGIAAVAIVLSNYTVDIIDDKISTPKVDVKANKKSGKKEDEILITTISSKHLESLAIDMPILGKFINAHDINSITDARATIKQSFIDNTNTSQSNIEYYIEDVKPERGLEYKILYEPAPPEIRIAGTDVYKISYSWSHSGKHRTAEKWISLKTGLEVQKPNGRIWSAAFFNRALTQEDVDRMYNEGLKRRNIGK